MNDDNTASAPSPPVFGPGTKFGILGLDDCQVIDFAGPLRLSDTVTAYTACPLQVPEHWREWLGSLRVGHLENANFLLVVARPSATPDILDQETKEIDQALTALWFGLLLHGVPDYSDGLVALGGVAADGAVSVRQVQRRATAYRHPFGERPVINAEMLASTRIVADTLLDLHGGAAYRRVR